MFGRGQSAGSQLCELPKWTQKLWVSLCAAALCGELTIVPAWLGSHSFGRNQKISREGCAEGHVQLGAGVPFHECLHLAGRNRALHPVEDLRHGHCPDTLLGQRVAQELGNTIGKRAAGWGRRGAVGDAEPFPVCLLTCASEPA